MLGEFLPLHLIDDYADDSNFLYRLYTCFKEPLKLDQYTFQKSKLFQAERVIVGTVNSHFKKAAMILETPADYSDQSEGFMVLWETPQPASGFHTLYLNDIYLCKDDLVQQILYEGMRIMCWKIYFGSWHGPYMDIVEQVAANKSDLEETIADRSKRELSCQDKIEIARDKKIVKQMQKEIDEYEAFEFNREVMPFAVYAGLVRKLNKRRYPELVIWANTIVNLYKRNIRITDFVPLNPEQTMMSAADYYFLALRPGYIADEYQSQVETYNNECSCNLHRIDYYVIKEGVQLSPHINWKEVCRILFGLNIKRLAKRTITKRKTLLQILT